MSGKFMSVKRIIVPTITMIIIASQLMGCAAASQSEMLQMINQGDAIEIEIAVPLNQQDGTEVTVEWTQLDQLTSQPTLRKSMDSIFDIVPFNKISKNGVFYVNLAGEQDGNNTLYNVFANSKFRDDYWNNVAIQSDIATAAAENYADVDYEEGNFKPAILAAMNGYFNILNDSEPGFANMDSTISRLEAMAAIFKAENPVTDALSIDSEFNAAVDADNSNEFTIFASNLSEQSYLDISSGSLDSLTANGTITRGELAYLIVQQYFKADYDKADPKAECFADAVNGGNIAQEQKFIEDATSKKHWQSYELSYALNNPDKGCPERMYKALVVAEQKGIITSTDCRWDEGATKTDLLEMLTNAYLAMPTQISASIGTSDEPVEVVVETKKETETSAVDSTGNDVVLEDGEYKGDDPADTVKEPTGDGISAEDQAMLDELYSIYQQGNMTKEEYEGWVDFFENDNGGLDAFLEKAQQSVTPAPEVVMPEGALELTPGGADENIQVQDHPGLSHIQVQ